jgi:hypothetical protein
VGARADCRTRTITATAPGPAEADPGCSLGSLRELQDLARELNGLPAEKGLGGAAVEDELGVGELRGEALALKKGIRTSRAP